MDLHNSLHIVTTQQKTGKWSIISLIKVSIYDQDRPQKVQKHQLLPGKMACSTFMCENFNYACPSRAKFRPSIKGKHRSNFKLRSPTSMIDTWRERGSQLARVTVHMHIYAHSFRQILMSCRDLMVGLRALIFSSAFPDISLLPFIPSPTLIITPTCLGQHALYSF